MAVELAGQSGKIAAAVREVVAEHGPDALSRPEMMSNLLADLLPESPWMARLLRAAAEQRIAEALRSYVGQGMDAATAAALAASSFAAATMFTPEACAWVVAELAVALGLMADDGVAAPVWKEQAPRAGKPTASPPILTASPPAPAGARPEPVQRDLPEHERSRSHGRGQRWRYGIGAAAVSLTVAVIALAVGPHRPALSHHPGTHPSTRGPLSVAAPADVVAAYFDAINQQDWLRVWNLGGKNLGEPYPVMVDGYAGTRHDIAAITSTDGGTVSVLLTALQTDGSTRVYNLSYQVSNLVIVHGRYTFSTHLPAGQPYFAAFSGTWQAGGRTLKVSPQGLGLVQFSASRWCASTPQPPCDTRSGTAIYRGGATVFQLTSYDNDHAWGYIVDSSVPGLTAGRIMITVRPSAGVLVIAGQSLTSPGSSGAAAYCKLRRGAGPCRTR